MLKILFETQNLVFIFIMMVLFITSLRKILKNPKEEMSSPGIIAALGIIGTFFGIFSGLLEFDTNNLEMSVPVLLNGMKTAFLTSLVGLILSNVLKGIKSKKKKKMGKSLEDTSLQTIVELMIEVNESIILLKNSQEMTGIQNQEIIQQVNGSILSLKTSKEMMADENKKMIMKLINSLIGDDEGTLTSQMKILGSDIIKTQEKSQDRLNENFDKLGEDLSSLVGSNEEISNEVQRGNDELISEFRSFAKGMAENNMKAFTKAIQCCIKDLNNQLQEQFGDNFKHLNYAVEKLLDWQEHYKETIEKTNIIQNELYKGMQEAVNLVQTIMSRTEHIVEVANSLGDKITTFDNQQKNLNSSIEILNKISFEARKIIPNLDDYINKYFESSEHLSNLLYKNMEKTYKNIEECIQFSDEKIKQASIKATEKITEQVVETTKKGIEEVNSASTVVLEAVHKVHEKASKELTKLSNVIDEKVEASIGNINILTKGLDHSTNKIIKRIEESTLSVEQQMIENNKNIDEAKTNILDLTKIATKNISEQQKEVVSAIQGITTSITDSSKLNSAAIEKQLKSLEIAVVRLENEGFTITKKISDNIQVMVDNNNTNLQNSVNNINTQLESTLNVALESLGNQLAAISEKFVSDYTPLTKELQKVVSLAKRIG